MDTGAHGLGAENRMNLKGTPKEHMHKLQRKVDVVDKGRIAERGTHDELVGAGGIYAKLVSRQMARQANQIEQDRVAAAAPGGPKAGGPKAAADNIDSIIDDLERERGRSGAASTETTREESTFQKKSK